MARLAVYRAESEEGPDVLRWLDRQLIRLVSLISYKLIGLCSDLRLILKPFLYFSVRNLEITTKMTPTHSVSLRLSLCIPR